MRLLVAIPCLNEAKTVGDVIAAIPRDIRGVTDTKVLIVDDGSSDETADVASRAGAEVVRHGHNLGVGAAFQTALGYVVEHGYDIMVNIDADGQFDAADIPELIAPIVADDADFVSASRFIDPSLVPPRMPWVKVWGNRRMSALISRLSGRKFYDVSCGFRAYSREALLHLNLYGRFTYTQETFLDLSRKELRIREVPIRVRYFDERISRVARSLFRYAAKTTWTILRFYRDYNPIRFFWGVSAIFTVLALAFASILGVHFLRTGQMSGQLWAGFVGGFFALNGLIFFVLGVIADMLDRIRGNQERILYILKRSTGGSAGPPRGDSDAD